MDLTEEELTEINNWNSDDFAKGQTEQLNVEEIKEIENWSDNDFAR